MTSLPLQLGYNPRAIDPKGRHFSLVPYITLREGEEAAPNNLVITRYLGGPRLYWADEDPRDRDPRGALWARCAWNPVDGQGRIIGEPQWQSVHPQRQMACMQAMRCQICTSPARTPLGFIFLAGPRALAPGQRDVITGQPPVCRKHVRPAAMLCPHLEGRPTVFVAQSAPLYGLLGTQYGAVPGGAKAIAQPRDPVPYSHPDVRTLLASQLFRRLTAFRVVDLDELLDELTSHTPA